MHHSPLQANAAVVIPEDYDGMGTLFNGTLTFFACLLHHEHEHSWMYTVFIRIEASGAKTKFWGDASFQKYIVGDADNKNDSAHEEDLDFETINSVY